MHRHFDPGWANLSEEERVRTAAAVHRDGLTHDRSSFLGHRWH